MVQAGEGGGAGEAMASAAEREEVQRRPQGQLGPGDMEEEEVGRFRSLTPLLVGGISLSLSCLGGGG